jgi:hypothetical protein
MKALSSFFRNPILFFLVLSSIIFVYLNSSLSFYPVPWPDDSAFFLAGLDWINWPSHYRMHSQAPFVDTYDAANFNIMPLLPLVFGVFRYFGFDSSYSLRIIGLTVFAIYTWVLVDWAKSRKFSTPWLWLIGLATITTPVLRWGATVARTEIWQALFWLLILRELDRSGKTTIDYSPRSKFKIPAYLALAAGFHYEAIVWVFPTAIALMLQNPSPTRAFRVLRSVTWRTLLLLSPWLIYVFTHLHELQTQLTIQFSRLDHHHPYLQDPYGAFHSIFLSMGQPLGYPKFFNAGKIITWSLILGTSVRCLYLALRDRGSLASVRVAVVLGMLTTGYLWITKPETWFTTLIYAGLWPSVLLSLRSTDLIDLQSPPSWGNTLKRTITPVTIVVLIVLQVGVLHYQWKKAREKFEWNRYESWVSCIESVIQHREKIWQVNIPDVLVELTKRNPKKDYTRSVDFTGVVPDLALRLQKHAQSREAIIHSLYFRPDSPDSEINYQGVLREFDQDILTRHPYLPLKEFSALQMGTSWSLSICHEGPFWAAISTQNLGSSRK